MSDCSYNFGKISIQISRILTGSGSVGSRLAKAYGEPNGSDLLCVVSFKEIAKQYSEISDQAMYIDKLFKEMRAKAKQKVNKVIVDDGWEKERAEIYFTTESEIKNLKKRAAEACHFLLEIYIYSIELRSK